jgi:hypothetical protein
MAKDRPRLWTNAEWGLRYYLEQIGAEPLESGQPTYSRSLVVQSEAAGRIPFSSSGGALREVLRETLRNRVPVRLFGLDTRSGYSSSALGVLPFDFGSGRLDIVQASIAGLPEARLSYLRMSDPAAGPQLLSGFYGIEDQAWRWMSGDGVVILRVPEGTSQFEIRFVIPEAAPARRVTVAADGITVANRLYPASGSYTLSGSVALAGRAFTQVVISVDRTFQAAGDRRRLGLIVQELGFR